ncbi:hypothetical protein FOL47_002785 [Perkinsus chesapeaki]|uniref:Protein kinase domain-containing protein n=1 Tax=Perkinsus chesapeaki TaxID=330153 RepID=A0A7J6N027_PERCH|nr:hypothetical protein FOL47_002785 [Perkinsus chesapeaki]
MGKVFSTVHKGHAGLLTCPQHITHAVADLTRELIDADSSIGTVFGRRAVSDLSDFDSKYVLDGQRGTLGKGKFGMVVACCLKSEAEYSDRQLFALKTVEASAEGGEAVERIREEIRILRLVRGHPHVITLRDVDDKSFGLTNTVRLVFDLCSGGDLYERIRQVGNYSVGEGKIVLRNLLGGVAFIHSKGLMHRDLKPENVLLVSRGSNTDIRIADFGLAKRAADFPRRLPHSRSVCGSDFYLAPEIIRQEEYGREIDLWSVGVVAYVVLTGSLPFYNRQLHKLYRQILERDINLDVIAEDFRPLLTVGARDLICRLLQLRSQDRLSAEEAFQHPIGPQELSPDTHSCPQHAGG